jgi:predicted TIM-barrel fold metal-dependent hydrolase
MRVDEYGRPAFDDTFPESTLTELRRLSRRRNVHVLLSGQYALSAGPPPYRDLDAVVREIADRYGATRMLWASDYPWTRDVPGYATLLALARQALPDASEAELADIHGATALRLFPTLRPAKDC